MFNNISLRIFIVITIVFCSISNIYGSINSEQRKTYNIKWEGLLHEKIEDEKKEFLSIGSSFYLDSLPGIPYFFDLLKNDVPHVSYEITLSEIEVKEVSYEEKAFLKKSGFKATDFVLQTKKVQQRGERFQEINIIPVRFNMQTGKYEKLISFSINKKYSFDEKYSQQTAQSYVDESVLNSGDWYKICVDETGIYKITYQDIKDLGVNPANIQRKNISLYGNGADMLPEANDEFRYDDLMENAIYVSGNPNGYFSSSDYILFYGKSPHQWQYNKEYNIWEHEVHLYSDQNCYFLSTNSGEGKRISQGKSLTSSPDTVITTFVDYDYHQEDQRNLLESGKIWYGETFNITLSRNFHFAFDDLVKGAQGFLKTHLAAKSTNFASSFSVNVFDKTLSVNIPVLTSSSYYHARDSEDVINFTQTSSEIPVKIEYNRREQGDMGWLRYISVNVERKLNFREPQLQFRATGISNKVAEYRLSNFNDNVEVWDVSDKFNIEIQPGTKQGGNYIFRTHGKDIMKFAAHDGSQYLKPDLEGKIPNQNLHGKKNHDLVIVTPSKLIAEAERLASFRRSNDGLSVLIVTTEEIYNEFSSGIPDVSAIRNFMKMFYDRAENEQQMPRYLLLFGNGTYDNKDILGFGGNLIPTFQSKNSLDRASSWVTDDFFGLLADGEGKDAYGNLDIGVGRLPVRNLNEATVVVDKLIRYDQRIEGWDIMGNNHDFAGIIPNYGDWRNRVALIADDKDNNVHFNDAEGLYEIMKENFPVFNIEKIYLDAYELMILAGGERYPEVNIAINNLVNKGALLINYIGHGGSNGLAHERIMTFDDIQSWNNYYNLTVFMTATCEFSAFDKPDPSNLPAGIRIMLKRNGGAAALFTTTRLAWTHSNRTLNREFMSNAFKPMSNGKYPRLGDMIRKAKVASGSTNNIMNFVLLGDPSMKLAFPELNVKTTSVPDTIKAFDKVNIKGQIVDNDGNLLSNYNGIIYPTVYDKKRTLTTLGNSEESIPAEFNIRTNNLYRGKATVKNGLFEFDFIVPKDIGYNFGKGKISYYIDDGSKDGNGFFNKFYVGGSSDNYETDLEGPEIKLFLNDTTFVSGDKVTPNPLLIAHIFDNSGINTTGQLGHDIVAILNDNTQDQYLLNNYYESDLDTYKSGRIIYPFSNLEEGKHTLSLRVWDVFNNPSTASIEFIVAESVEFALKNLINYPNPFSHNTTFEFSYTQTDDYDLDVNIDIYNIKGQKVANIFQNINITGFDDFRIEWNGTNNDGEILEPGLYIYKVNVSTPDGTRASESSKLIIMK